MKINRLYGVRLLTRKKTSTISTFGTAFSVREVMRINDMTSKMNSVGRLKEILSVSAKVMCGNKKGEFAL